MAQEYTIRWHGPAVLAAERGGAVKGLTYATEHLLQVAREKVPVDEATLVRSGVASVDRDELTAAVSFDTLYAVRQHEDLTLQHAPGRSAKYLEQPAVEQAQTMTRLIATQIKRALE